MKKTYIIGEIGINHQGDLSIAKRLIDIAAAKGLGSKVSQAKCRIKTSL